MRIYKDGNRWVAQMTSHHKIYGKTKEEVIHKAADNQVQMQTAKTEITMKKLSNGMDSTLENWIRLSTSTFGENSKQTAFLKEKAANSPNGIKEEVAADEGQLLYFLMNMEGN